MLNDGFSAAKLLDLNVADGSGTLFAVPPERQVSDVEFSEAYNSCGSAAAAPPLVSKGKYAVGRPGPITGDFSSRLARGLLRLLSANSCRS